MEEKNYKILSADLGAQTYLKSAYLLAHRCHRLLKQMCFELHFVCDGRLDNFFISAFVYLNKFRLQMW